MVRNGVDGFEEGSGNVWEVGDLAGRLESMVLLMILVLAVRSLSRLENILMRKVSFY